MKNLLLLLFLAAALALILFGKRPDSFRLPDGRPVKNRVIVTYWEKWSNTEAAAMQEIVDQFNMSQDRIFVQFVSMSQINQKLLIATAGGDPPDIAGTFASQVGPCAANGTIEPLNELSPLVNADRYKPFVWAVCAPDGKTPYAAAATPVVNALYYNTDLLAAEKPPQTLEELDALSARLTRRTYAGVITQMGFLPTEPGWYDYDYGVYFGNTLFDGHTFHIGTPQNAAAYRWMQTYSARYGTAVLDTFKPSAANFNSPANAFIAGKLAMVLQGPYFATFIAQHNKNLHYGVVPFPLPAGVPAASRALADLDVWVIPHNAPHPAEARQVIAYFSQQKQLEQLCSRHAKPSPLKDVSLEFLAHHPNAYIRVFEDLCNAPGLQTLPACPAWERVRSQLDQTVSAIWNGQDVDTTLADAQKIVDRFVAEQQHNDDLRRKACAGETQ